MSKKSKVPDNNIALNKKAQHEYFIEERFEAGIVLEGWEVKSLRDKRVQLTESHVIIKQGEAWLLNALITPLPTASTHIVPESARTRKLLLHRKELNKLIGSVERKGYTIVPVSMYWKNGRAKVQIALAKGKKQHDKRETVKAREWQRDKARVLKKF